MFIQSPHKINARTLLACAYLVGLAFLSSCGLNRQANSMKALRQCKFEIVGLDSLTLAGTDIRPMIIRGDFDVTRLPAVALSFLSGDLPLRSVLQLKITNPTRHTAGVRQFQYEILMDENKIIDGTSNLPIEVGPHSTDTVLVDIHSNVYQLISDRANRTKILRLLESSEGSEQRVHLALRIKPTIGLGNKAIDYPGYITLEKTVDRAMISRLWKTP